VLRGPAAGMTGDRLTDLAAATPGPDAATPGPDTVTADQAAATVDRRRFVKSIAGESVTTAGRLAGISGMLMGSVVSAAKAAGDTFTALGGSTTPTAAAAPAASVMQLSVLPAPAAPAPAPTPATPLRLSEADLATLTSLRVGLLATNQPGAAPAVGVVRFVFDGTTFRIPGRSATARTGNLQRDPFASLTLIDPENGDALLLAGRARIVYGTDGRDGSAAVLAACDVPLTDGWEAPDSRGEPILVVLEPQRLFRRRAGDERP